MAQTKIQSVQLSDTGVVPGTYTTANVTVDSSGRLTAVESGTAGTTLVEPATQIVYGTGTGVDSDSTLTYDTATSTMVVGSLTDHALIESEDNFDLIVSSGGFLGLSARSGNVEIAAPFGSIVIYSELQTNGSGGSYGDVLTSHGPGTPPVWEAPFIPIGGGAEPIYSWQLGGLSNGSFDGSLFNDWQVTHYNHNFTSPKVVWNSGNDWFEINDFGTYEITISATLTAFPYFPVGPATYGIYLGISGGGSYSTNPTHHSRNLDPSEFQSAPYPASESYTSETWAETFIISVYPGTTMTVQTYAFNYSNASSSLPYMNMTMTMQKINDYVQAPEV